MNAIDTNIWVYCHDTRDPAKQQKAQRLLETIESLVLLWQVGCEFMAAARKLEHIGFTKGQAWESLADMQSMASVILLPTPDIWPLCQAIQKKHGIHYWDALILAACMHDGVKTLYSEDIPENDDFNGLRIVNPFRNG